MAIDEDNNLPVAILGGDALLATDIVTNAGVTSHVQLMKTTWGDDNYSYKVNATTPMPVRLYGSSGDRVTVTGGVFGLGTFVVGNSFVNPIYIANGSSGNIGITGFIQGISGGFPVGVTGSVSIIGFVGITGLVSTTGGRALTFGTDSIRVYGEIGTTRAWSLSASTDTVKISPIQGGFTHSVYVAGSNGVAIGASADALKVWVSNVGLSLSATIEPTVYVRNATGGDVKVSGVTWTSLTNPIPVVVRGTKASESANAGNNPGDMIVSFAAPQQVSVAGTMSVDTVNRSNLYNLFIGASGSGNTASVGVNVANMSTNINSINNRLSLGVVAKVTNETSTISTIQSWRIGFVASASQAAVSIANPSAPGLIPVHGTHIKNTSNVTAPAVGLPPVSIEIGVGTNPRYILDPGESLFIPLAVFSMTARIAESSINASNDGSDYRGVLTILSV